MHCVSVYDLKKLLPGSTLRAFQCASLWAYFPIYSEEKSHFKPSWLGFDSSITSFAPHNHYDWANRGSRHADDRTDKYHRISAWIEGRLQYNGFTSGFFL